jgi:hypothetical protein
MSDVSLKRFSANLMERMMSHDRRSADIESMASFKCGCRCRGDVGVRLKRVRKKVSFQYCN